jgi:hypothetical protein
VYQRLALLVVFVQLILLGRCVKKMLIHVPTTLVSTSISSCITFKFKLTKLYLFVSGTCITDSSKQNGFHCLCQKGYIGSTCNEFIDTNSICSSSHCPKSHNCVPIDSTKYECICPINLTGKFCESRIRICDTRPCLRGGTCLENYSLNTYSCHCPVGLTGEIKKMV